MASDPSGICQRQIFLNRQMRRRSFHRILEHAPDLARPAVLRQKSDILTIQENLSLIQPVIAADRIKSVDFPAPLEPMIVTNSPSSRCRSSPFKAWCSLAVPAENTLVACFTSNIVHLHLLSLFVTAFQVIIYTYLFLSSASSLKAPSDNGSPEAPAPPLRCTLIPVLTHMPEKSGSWLPLR